MEDGLLYKTIQVVVRKSLFVGYRAHCAHITAERQQIEVKTLNYVAENPGLHPFFGLNQKVSKFNLN